MESVAIESISENNREYTADKLEWLRSRIDAMDKKKHVEILKLLKTVPEVKLNENKSGVFVNLSFLSRPILDMLASYIDATDEQESSFMRIETQKEEFKNTFFSGMANMDGGSSSGLWSREAT